MELLTAVHVTLNSKSRSKNKNIIVQEETKQLNTWALIYILMINY